MNRDNDSGDGDSPNSGWEQSVRRAWEDADSPTMAVVQTVAAATGQDVTDLPPLRESVDSDALNALVGHGTDAGSDLQISFHYAGTDVFVDAEGNVTVRPLNGSE